MSNAKAARRLYLGAGEYIEKGKSVRGMSATEIERLRSTGAIEKAEAEPQNKMEGEPAEKGKRARKTKADK